LADVIADDGATMPRLTKIYTKTGDDGTTGLGGGQRVAKDALRIEVFGTVDELNAQLGVALAAGLEATLAAELMRVQNELFHLGSDLCVLESDKMRRPVPHIEDKHVRALETSMDKMTETLGPLTNFILPGGSVGAAHLHVARTVCRRAERLAVRLGREEPIGSGVVPYLNRLSDSLFVMARWENRHRGVADVTWNSRL
jgi:cob(I)alamin adenosyltransferase